MKARPSAKAAPKNASETPAMASEAVGACFDDAVKEVFNDMLVDAISEETLERLEEEYFSDGLDELVPMLQDAHVLSEHWYLTKAQALQLRYLMQRLFFPIHPA